jgi:acyl-CoA synthetase (AMP-forming)/AMP-acid ligase II
MLREFRGLPRKRGKPEGTWQGETLALVVPELGYKPTIGESIRRAAQEWPDRDFIVMPNRRITYGEAEAASRRLGRALLATGIGKGSRVGIFDTYSAEWVIAWLAATRIGALAMPFSSIYKPAELRAVLRIGDVHTLVVPSALLGRSVPDMLEEAVPSLAGTAAGNVFLSEMPYLRQVWMWGASDRSWVTLVDVLGEADLLPRVPDRVFDEVESEVVPADWAQVTYTSGSSALPKGVVHSHGAIVRTTGVPMQVGPASAPILESALEHEINFNAFPLFWIGGTLVLGRALRRGTTVCCLERFDPGPALDLIEREHCTSVTGWPSLIQALKGHPSFAQRDLSQVSTFAGVLPGMHPGPVPGFGIHRSMSELVGNWNGSERQVIDPETGEVLPDLAEGELVVRGFGMMQGYYKKEREETFDQDGWLHTGDRAFMYENQPYFVGRFYEMVKSQGANVSPREVEVVLEVWPEIQHVFVFGTPHPVLEEEVTAVIVFMPGFSMTPDEIRTRAARELSSFKVPTRLEILDDGSTLPWLGSGKPDKLQLRSRFVSGEPTS